MPALSAFFGNTLMHASRQGQFKIKTAALVRYGIKAYAASHALYQLLADIQTQPGTALFARIGRIRLREFLEYALTKLVGNARTVIDHLHSHFAGMDAHGNVNLTAGR
jgi:hypothetical protein